MRSSSTLLNQFEDKLHHKKIKPFLYEVGQKVRIRKNIVQDGQTPEYWSGALCQILSRQNVGMFLPKHMYKVRLLHGDKICDFFEYEIDMRYIRKNLDKQ